MSSPHRRLSLAFSSGAAQQNPGPTATAISASVVPRLVSFGGALNDASGKPISNISGVTSLIYRDEQGGAPLWLETQNVTPDSTGQPSHDFPLYGFEGGFNSSQCSTHFTVLTS